MGIITAFVNQLGREAARDVYRGVKSKLLLKKYEG